MSTIPLIKLLKKEKQKLHTIVCQAVCMHAFCHTGVENMKGPEKAKDYNKRLQRDSNPQPLSS